jgi:uncharacterized SAM-binding protein YcdF (DUF218 family)
MGWARDKQQLPSRRHYKLRLGAILALMPMLWLGHQQVQAYLQEPQALLVLGGAIEREKYAARYAQEHPEIKVWVSSGTNPEYAKWLFFDEFQLDRDRIILDYQAVDTVTNFTTLVDELKDQGITCVYVVTSDYHMQRAMIIGQIVLGSRGIAFRPLAVPSNGNNSENMLRSARDGARSVLWVLTGHTGAALGHSLGHKLGML